VKNPTQSPCAAEGRAGLVSFSNKGQEKTPDELAQGRARDIAASKRRQARMRSGVITAARVINNRLLESETPHRSAMITLTYRPGVDWEPSHIRKLLKHYREFFRKRGHVFRCVWKLETTTAGVPHYHVVTWIPKGCKPPLPDKQGWWPHGMTQAIYAHSPVGYIAKYAAKDTGPGLPKGARIWGHCGLDAEGKFEVARALAPRWLKRIVSPQAQLKRVMVAFDELRRKGGRAVVLVAGFLDELTGFRFLSPWVSEGFTSTGLALRHRGYVEAFSSDGDYFRIKTEREVFA
jgi:hypothetical protein